MVYVVIYMVEEFATIHFLQSQLKLLESNLVKKDKVLYNCLQRVTKEYQRAKVNDCQSRHSETDEENVLLENSFICDVKTEVECQKNNLFTFPLIKNIKSKMKYQ